MEIKWVTVIGLIVKALGERVHWWLTKQKSHN